MALVFRNFGSTLLALSLSAPIAFAAGSDDSSAPSTTKTTQECESGMVWDEKSKECVAPKDSRLNDDQRFEAVREFAYVGDFGAALGALDAMQEGQSDRVLTYLGFVHRKMGDVETGMGYYAAALAQNPDNLLARSYRGQALVLAGDFVGAREEVLEIRARGGAGTWPEIALLQVIDGKTPTNY